MTLIELLVAIGLVVLLAAVALPVTLSRLRSASVDEVQARVEAGVMMGRAEAQRRGVALELCAVELGEGVVLAVRGAARGGDSEEQGRTWEELVELPPRVRLSVPGDRPESSREDRAGEVAEVRVAVLLPDGRVFGAGGESIFVESDGLAVGVVLINSWTGAVRVEPVERGQGWGGRGGAGPGMEMSGRVGGEGRGF